MSVFSACRTCPRSTGRPGGSTPSRSAPPSCAASVVLVNFWTLTCINWLRQEPYVRAWSRAYRDDGLVVIGVHTPEFSFEHDIDRVRRATAEREIDYPVARRQRLRGLERLRQPLLAGALLRRRGGRHPRPALRRGPLRAVGARHPAAARRRARARRRSRGSAWRRRPTGTTCARPRPTSATGAASASRHRAAPRSTSARLRAARAPAPQPLGARRRVDDRARERRARPRPAGASPSASTRATRISCCRPERGRRSPSACSSTASRPGPSHGVDVDEDGNGVLDDGRLYQLVRQQDGVRERTLEITFVGPGAEAYSFTFG